MTIGAVLLLLGGPPGGGAQISFSVRTDAPRGRGIAADPELIADGMA